jgi:hypothetical protein
LDDYRLYYAVRAGKIDQQETENGTSFGSNPVLSTGLAPSAVIGRSTAHWHL